MEHRAHPRFIRVPSVAEFLSDIGFFFSFGGRFTAHPLHASFVISRWAVDARADRIGFHQFARIGAQQRQNRCGLLRDRIEPAP